MLGNPKRPFLVSVFVLLVVFKACLLLIPIFVTILATPESTLQLIGDSMLIGDVRYKLLAVLIAWTVFTAYVGVGLWRGKSIARHFFLALLLVLLLMAVVLRQRYIELPLVVAVSGLVVWYLYAKPNVRSFFEAT